MVNPFEQGGGKGQQQRSVPPPGTGKPTALEPIFENFPAELTDLPNWLMWKYEPPKKPTGKWRKVPYQPNGRLADTTKKRTWSSFETCCAVYEQGDYDGIGFVFDGEVGPDGCCYGGIDFDNCLTVNGKDNIDPVAQKRIKQLDTYSERSVSNTGFHCICRTLPLAGRKLDGVEVYTRARYFTFTGHGSGKIRIATAELQGLIAEARQNKRADADKPASVDGTIFAGAKVAEAFAHLDPNKNLLGEGVKEYWYDLLQPEQKDQVVDHALQVIVTFLEKNGKHTNPLWFSLTVAVARSGAPHAEDIFVKRASATNNPEPEEFLRKHFIRCQRSPSPKYRPITVGTLLGLAREHGADFEKWKRLVPDAPILPPGKRPPLKGGQYNQTEALELLNSHFFVGRRDQEPVEIYRINDDGSLTLYPQKAFNLEAGNIFVPGQEKPIQANTWWPKHRQRHQRKIVFKPHGTNDPSEYNLWLGFGVEPGEGREKSRSLLQHIFKVICRSNREHFQYLICWMAWKVQNPDRHPETVVVLKSKYQGTGKSLLGDVMSMIFGRHALLVDSQSQIFGDFTEHLELACFVQMEEILFAGDHRTTDRVKSFITGRTISIHCKFGPRFPIPNRIASMLFTNHDHAVALGAKDRRFFVLDVDTQYAGDLAYFKHLWDDINNGGVNEFLYQLLDLPLGNWHPREMIKTQEAIEQQRMSADPISQWAQECIDDDIINTGRGTYDTISYDLGTRVKTKDLYGSCVFSCRHRGVRPPDPTGFGKACTEMFGPRQHVEDGKRRPYGYNVPKREIWQERLNERLGIPTPDDVAELLKRPIPRVV